VVAGIAGALVLRPWEPKALAPQGELPSGLQLATGHSSGGQPRGPAATVDSTAGSRRDTAAPTVAAALPPAAQTRAAAPSQRRETPPRNQQQLATAPERRGAPGVQAAVSPAGQQQASAPPPTQQQAAASPAVPPSQQAAQPAAQPTVQPPAAQATGRLFVTAVPTPSMIKVNGQPVGPAIINREFPPGTYVLRFEGVDSLGPWFSERSVEIRPGEPTRLTRIGLQLRRP
jgi:hypothetical protein